MASPPQRCSTYNVCPSIWADPTRQPYGYCFQPYLLPALLLAAFLFILATLPFPCSAPRVRLTVPSGPSPPTVSRRSRDAAPLTALARLPNSSRRPPGTQAPAGTSPSPVYFCSLSVSTLRFRRTEGLGTSRAARAGVRSCRGITVCLSVCLLSRRAEAHPAFTLLSPARGNCLGGERVPDSTSQPWGL